MRCQALALALLMVGAVGGAGAAPMLALRFHDDNPRAQQEALDGAAQREVEAAAGFPLVARGRGSDGAFLFSPAVPLEPVRLRDALNRLRATGAVVYADAYEERIGKRAGDAGAAAPRALLVKWRTGAAPRATADVRAIVALKAGGGASTRRLSGGVERLALPRALAADEARALVAQLEAHPDVLHAEIDRRATVQATPGDPMFAGQWSLAASPGGVDAPAAWEVTTGSAEVPIAVLDTGVLPHPDLAGRIVAGYDFVSDPVFAGDGDGRDGDPVDPGDFVTTAQANDATSPLHGCNVTNSTWHGTMVAGALGAAANNGIGLAALNWSSPLVNVRVLGRCGGTLSDIADGVRWAAGVPVPGVPANPRPARVVNLSFAGHGPCGATLQSAITDAVARGAVVVAAAGNDNAAVDERWPANCNGVIPVGATSRDGSRGFYSNHGARLAVSAPGGGIGASIDVLRNTGTTVADAAGWAYGAQVGTSLAAPLVSGTLSLMQAKAPQMSPAELHALLEQSARAFPAVPTDGCTVELCGAGIVDAGAAVRRAAGSGGATPVPPAPQFPPEAPPVVTPPPGATPPPADAPPPTRVPVPGGWTAKDVDDLAQLLKSDRPADDGASAGAPRDLALP